MTPLEEYLAGVAREFVENTLRDNEEVLRLRVAFLLDKKVQVVVEKVRGT